MSGEIQMTIQQRHNELLQAAKRHYAADEMLVKGSYGKLNGSFKGCSIGCLAHEMGLSEYHSHKQVADYYKYPEWLAHLQDYIFENLPDGENRKWHVEIAERIQALPPRASWKKINHKVHMAILNVAMETAGETKSAVYDVYKLHKKASEGKKVSDKTWSAAESAAWSAARSAAESAAWSAARSAARSAAESAAWSATWSAYAQKLRVGILEAIK